MRAGRRGVLELAALAVAVVVFVVPFVFMALTAVKDEDQSLDLDFSWPTGWHVLDNLRDVFAARNSMLVTAFRNSLVVTVASVAIVVLVSAMIGFVMQRRPGRLSRSAGLLVLSGLIIPPAVVPTIWVLQNLGLFKTLPGLILVEVAFQMPFCVLLFRAFVATIPRELDEAAVLDGAGPFTLFFRVVLPLMRPVTTTVVLVTSVTVFNDFVNPLYFLPGDENATVQLTLYNFMSQFSTHYNLLFTDIVLITLPPLALFVLFNRRIVAGMTAGALKG